MLLEAGAPKDRQNAIGWAPLHEAAFYNHLDVVRLLLVYGADATLRDAQDALPYHVASAAHVREVIADMGGPDAALARHGATEIAFHFGMHTHDGGGVVAADDAPLLAEAKDGGDDAAGRADEKK